MENFFRLRENNTTVSTEVMAGITTFFTMSYIIFVNPLILSQTGMPWGAVYLATIIAAILGAEVVLAPVNLLVQPIVPGATMRGGREDGFGELNDRVQDICAPGDTVCDAPPGLGDALARAQEYVAANGAHATYAENPGIIPGTTSVAWTTEWAAGLIDGVLASR